MPLIPYIDSLDSLKRHVDGPFMMPIVDKYSEMGTVVIGKVESGAMKKGDMLVIMPNRVSAVVQNIQHERDSFDDLLPGRGEG